MGNRTCCMDPIKFVLFSKSRVEAYYSKIKQICEEHGNRSKGSARIDHFLCSLTTFSYYKSNSF